VRKKLNPSEVRSHGISIKNKYIAMATDNNLEINDWIATLLALIEKQGNTITFLNDELAKARSTEIKEEEKKEINNILGATI
jgi:hypothetical protein